MSDVVVNKSKMLSILDWGYEKALGGLPHLDSAEEMAQSYLNKSKNVEEAIDSLINWQKAKCATSGFVTGVGGLLTMPVALPANITSVIYIQLRMIAAIAYMSGFNPKDDQVRTLAYICLCGNSAKDIVKVAGIKIGQKITENMIKKFLVMY